MKKLFILVPALLLLGAGCDSSATVQTTATTPTAQAPSEAPKPQPATTPSSPLIPKPPLAQAPVILPPQNNRLSVSIAGMSFQQASVTVSVGTTVEWSNKDSVAHTVTAKDKSFSSGKMSPGSTYSHTFTKAGTYSYSCTIHPSMKGTVIVQ